MKRDDATTMQAPRLSPRRSVMRALRLRCPLCGRAAIYAGWVRVHEHCPECGLRFQREPGYFVGAAYLNAIATLSVLLIVSLAVLVPRPDVGDAFYAWMIVIASAVPLLLFRHSRAAWLSLDYLVSPPKPEEVKVAWSQVKTTGNRS